MDQSETSGRGLEGIRDSIKEAGLMVSRRKKREKREEIGLGRMVVSLGSSGWLVVGLGVCIALRVWALVSLAAARGYVDSGRCVMCIIRP